MIQREERHSTQNQILLSTSTENKYTTTKKIVPLIQRVEQHINQNSIVPSSANQIKNITKKTFI